MKPCFSIIQLIVCSTANFLLSSLYLLSHKMVKRLSRDNFPQEKTKHTIPCSVSSSKDNNGVPEVKSDNWPSTLIMQLIPKSIVQTIGSHYFKNSKSVLFHPDTHLLLSFVISATQNSLLISSQDSAVLESASETSQL